MVTIACWNAKQMISKVIANNKKHTSFFLFNPLNKKSTPVARDSYERNNSLSYEFKFIKKGKEYSCKLESIVCCPNNTICYRENFVINSQRDNLAGVKKLYKLLNN